MVSNYVQQPYAQDAGEAGEKLEVYSLVLFFRIRPFLSTRFDLQVVAFDAGALAGAVWVATSLLLLHLLLPSAA